MIEQGIKLESFRLQEYDSGNNSLSRIISFLKKIQLTDLFKIIFFIFHCYSYKLKIQ